MSGGKVYRYAIVRHYASPRRDRCLVRSTNVAHMLNNNRVYVTL